MIRTAFAPFGEDDPTWATRKNFEYRVWLFQNWYDVPYLVYAAAWRVGIFVGYRTVT